MQIYLLVFLAGALQTTMGSVNGVLQGYIGQFGVSLVTHVVGGGLLLGYLLFKRQRLKLWPMPWYLYSAGFLGLIQVAATSLCMQKIGPALTTCLSIAGQLSQSILVDHFGWVGVRKTPFDKRRIPPLAVIVAGILVMNLGGAGAIGAGAAENGGYVLLAFLVGGVGIYSEAVNFRASECLGTANGTLVNYVVASGLSILLLTFTGGGEGWVRLGTAPFWAYLGGICGVVAMVIIVTSLKKIALFQAATLLLLGRLSCSTLLDGILFQNMSGIKLLGVAVVTAGVVWDKKLSLAEA